MVSEGNLGTVTKHCIRFCVEWQREFEKRQLSLLITNVVENVTFVSCSACSRGCYDLFSGQIVL